jgi:S1/P1 Nuclease
MLLAAALLLYSLPAFAWGGLGHEAICELAFRELDDTARQRVIALIRQDQEFTTFRASCNWADKPRQRASEHFVSRAGRPVSIGISAPSLKTAWCARSRTTLPSWRRPIRPSRVNGAVNGSRRELA